MNEQAQLAAAVLAGFFLQGAPAENGAVLSAVERWDVGPRRQIVEISTASCHMLASYTGAPGVAYQPGVDVKGQPVVSASLSEPAYRLRPIYEFNVRILPLANDPALAETPMDVARVAIETGSGRITLDGREISRSHRQALDRACEARADGADTSSD